jgi:hypothetical protein
MVATNLEKRLHTLESRVKMFEDMEEIRNGVNPVKLE